MPTCSMEGCTEEVPEGQEQCDAHKPEEGEEKQSEENKDEEKGPEGQTDDETSEDK
jgi:hypothetical protein